MVMRWMSSGSVLRMRSARWRAESAFCRSVSEVARLSRQARGHPIVVGARPEHSRRAWPGREQRGDGTSPEVGLEKAEKLQWVAMREEIGESPQRFTGLPSGDRIRVVPHGLVRPVAKTVEHLLAGYPVPRRDQLVERLAERGHVRSKALDKRGGGRSLDLDPPLRSCPLEPPDGVPLAHLLDRDRRPRRANDLCHRRRDRPGRQHDGDDLTPRDQGAPTTRQP